MKRLVLLDDAQAEFLEMTMGIWEEATAGERGDVIEGKRMDLWNIRRMLERKFTKAETEEIAQVALTLLD